VFLTLRKRKKKIYLNKEPLGPGVIIHIILYNIVYIPMHIYIYTRRANKDNGLYQAASAPSQRGRVDTEFDVICGDYTRINVQNNTMYIGCVYVGCI